MEKRVDLFSSLQDTERKLTAEIAQITEQYEVLGHSADLLRTLFDRIVKQETDFVADTVTAGLRTVFHDQKLALKATFSVRASKVGIDLALSREEDGSATVEGNPIDVFGGGPVSLASILLRMVTLLKSGKVRFLLLDETAGPISSEYIDNCGLFLKTLAEKFGVDILLVAHKPEYLDHAHTAYTGTEVVVNHRPQFKALKVKSQ